MGRISGEDAPSGSANVESPRGPLAATLRGFGPLGIAATLIVLFAGVPVISALLVLVWARLSATPWVEIGYRRPRSWPRTIIVGLALGVALKLALKAVVMPLLGADPINRTYHFLAGNPGALPAMLLTVTVGAGFGEETEFRGFLFARLRALLGRGPAATAAVIALTSAWFGAAHYPDQGLAAAEQAAIVGLVLGSIYARSGSLWLPMVVHAAFDLAAVAMIYWNVESTIAHLVFK